MDYSQIELRILAHFSQDSALIQAFQKQEDIHTLTAAQIFYEGDTPEHRAQVSSEQRRYAKSINFGLIYGMSAFGLSQQLGIETKLAQQYIERYFARYPSILQYLESIKQSAREHGYVQTLLGRRIYLPDIQSRQHPKRQAAERLAINAPMQGSAADIIKLAMIAIDQTITNDKLRSQMILQVHDELVFEVPKEELDEILPLFAQKMEKAYPLNVPLQVSIEVGNHWGVEA